MSDVPEMIERVAKAVAHSRIDCYGSDEDIARAAIEAMREPVESMRWAGVAIAGPALKESAPNYPMFHPTLHLANEIWRAMIEDALGEAP